MVNWMLQTDVDTRRAELDALKDMPEYMRQQEKSNLQRWLTRWSPMRKRIGLAAIRGTDGIPIVDHAQAAAELCRHWQQVFAYREIDFEVARTLVGENVTPFPVVEWNLSFQEFDKKLQHTNDSAPGLDGIACTFWRRAPEQARRDLYGVYVDMCDGMDVAVEFNHSFFAFFAKGSEASDDVLVARSACDTRPLSLSNAVPKVVAGAIATPFEKVAQTCVSQEQRAFIHGRVMMDSVIDIESQGVAFTAQRLCCS